MEEKIVNLTQHPSTPEQAEEGVYDVGGREELKSLLTFSSLPSREEVKERAEKIASIAVRENAHFAMIGGAPYLMAPLENALLRKGIKPLYAFSKRESVEKVVEGEVVKTVVFHHLGFVEV